ILVVEEDHTISGANEAAAEQFGLPVKEMAGHSIHMLVPAFGTRSGEGLGVRSDGSSFPAEISIGHYVDKGRDASVCVRWDVLERRRLAQLKSEYVSTGSNELRTPLTSIRASLGS